MHMASYKQIGGKKNISMYIEYHNKKIVVLSAYKLEFLIKNINITEGLILDTSN